MLEDSLCNWGGLTALRYVSCSRTLGSLIPLCLCHTCTLCSHICWSLQPEEQAQAPCQYFCWDVRSLRMRSCVHHLKSQMEMSEDVAVTGSHWAVPLRLYFLEQCDVWKLSTPRKCYRYHLNFLRVLPWHLCIPLVYFLASNIFWMVEQACLLACLFVCFTLSYPFYYSSIASVNCLRNN